MYRIRVARSAKKELLKLPKEDVERVVEAIDELAEEPRPRGSKKLKGQKGLWRIRIGPYRVVYSIEDDVEIVEIVRVGHRRDIYR